MDVESQTTESLESLTPPAGESRPLDPPDPAENHGKPLSQTPSAIASRERRARKQKKNPQRRTTAPVITPRLSMFVTDGGDINFERTSGETVDRLKRALATPEARKRLGLVDDAGTPTAPGRSWNSMSGALVDALNLVCVQAAVNTWKLTDDQAALLVLKRKPDTHQGVTHLTGELLDKYFPGGFGDYDKEISLLVLLGSFVSDSVREIRRMRGPATVHTFPSAEADAAARS